MHVQVMYRTDDSGDLNWRHGCIFEMCFLSEGSDSCPEAPGEKFIKPLNTSVQLHLTICFIAVRGRKYWFPISTAAGPICQDSESEQWNKTRNRGEAQ